MNELEINSFLTNDYIYIPFDNKETINLRSNKIVFKNDDISTYNGKKIFSPVSGKAYGISQIYSINGVKNVLVIENDFKDKVSKKLISVKDIYEIDRDKIRELTTNISTKKILTLEINYDDKYNIKDEYLLKDYINEILETLNIIDITHDSLEIKIRLDKRDIYSYQTLFSFLGTYPNIEVVFNKENNINETTVTIYDILDIYNKIKNKNIRDFIYLTVISSNQIKVIKTKRNSNLKDLLEYLNLMSTKIIINNKIKIENGNFLLDENINTVNII